MVVVGDTLLDRDIDGSVSRICPDAPAPVLDETTAIDRPGGAGLAALLAAAQGYDVALITALAADAGGDRLAELLAAAGVTVFALPCTGATAEKVRLRAGGRVLLRLDRGGMVGEVPGAPSAAALAELERASAVLVSDYGRGVTRQAEVRAALTRTGAPVVWDPHPRGPAAVPGARLVTPNEGELRGLTGVTEGGRLAAAARGAEELRRRWRAGAVVVTLGADGALLSQSGPTPLVVPVPARAEGDTCGAGDRFAIAAAIALAGGALVSEAVQEAVDQAAAYVAAGGVATAVATAPVARPGEGTATQALPPAQTAPPWRTVTVDAAVSSAATSAADSNGGNGRHHNGKNNGNGNGNGGTGGDATEAGGVLTLSATPPGGDGPGRAATTVLGAMPAGADAAGALVSRVRAAGGTVVASGGCFDLLHAGHVATLEAARRLGDCLVVCLNSDASVRALKGPERPVVGEADRTRLLSALACVDAVVMFDETTPHAVLSWLRPDVWVKGGDYSGGAGDASDLPEAELVARWGGQTVVVPYLDGHSTTRMIAAARGGNGHLPKGEL
ncbi:MAG TPA: PfkB family carbohydrate kinase [Pilimelia sp.]|nr:PfkB family carbohydrate kinase [Pilimelia sp.]